MESKKVVQHVYLVGAKSIYRVAEKDKEYLRDEEEKNQNTACGASCWRRGSLHPNASQVFGSSFSKVRTYSIVKRELCPNLLNRAQNNGGWLTHLSAGVVSQSESSSDHTSILKEKSKAG